MQNNPINTCAVRQFLQFGVTVDSPLLYFIPAIDINASQISIPYKDKNSKVADILDSYFNITSRVNESQLQKCFQICNGPYIGEFAPFQEIVSNLAIDEREICFIVRIYDDQKMNKSIQSIRKKREGNGWIDVNIIVVGNNKKCEVKTEWSLKDLKLKMIEKFQELSNVTPTMIRIQHKGFFLTNQNQIIKNLGITKNSTIVIIVSTPENSEMQNEKMSNFVVIVKTIEGGVQRVQINPILDYVFKIKQILSVRSNINPFNLSLFFGGIQLKNYRTIKEYNIARQSIIHVRFRKSQFFNYLHPDTKILMGTNKYKKICEIEQKQEIFTYDIRSKTIIRELVTNIQKKHVKQYIETNLDNYEKCLITNGDAYIQFLNGEVHNIKKICYLDDYEKDQRYLIKRIGESQRYRIKAMAHFQNQSEVCFYRLGLMSCQNYIAEGVIIHKLYVNVVIIGAFDQIKQFLTIPIDHSSTVRDLKIKISELAGIDRTKLKLWCNEVDLDVEQLVLSQSLLKNEHMVVVTVIGEIEKMKSSIIINQSGKAKDQKRFIYLQIEKNKKVRLEFNRYKSKTCQQIMNQYSSEYKSSYFFVFAELVLLPTDRLQKVVDSQQFQQNQNTIIVIKNQKFRFVKNMFIDVNSVKHHSYFLSQNLINISNILQSKIQQKIKYTNSIQYQQAFRRIYSDNRVKDCYKQPQFIELFLIHSQRKYVKEIQKIIKNYQDYETLRKQIPDIDTIFLFIKQLYIKSNLLENYIGMCHFGIKNFKFSQYFKKGNTFYWHSFTSTSKSDIDIREELKGQSGTLFHINSLTGKQIDLLSLYPEQLEVLFSPYSYFLVDKIKPNKDMDQVWLSEIPSPVTFEKGIILWVDDRPQNNLQLIDDILKVGKHSIQILQVTSTVLAEKWIKQFGWLLNWKDIEFKLISDMKRFEGDEPNKIQNQQAGIDLLEILYTNHGVTAFTLIFCWNKQRAQQNIRRRNINQRRYHKITTNQNDLKEFCKMKSK